MQLDHIIRAKLVIKLNYIILSSSLLIKMRVDVTPVRTHAHRDLGRIRIIHKPISDSLNSL